jgi:signal recognition particle receptor subunit beta
VVVVSYSGKEINAKLVYYGAGLCGKTTNLEAIYEAVPDTSRGKMVSMKTQSDRTLFFDLLPLDLGEIMGFKTRFLLYTVPGQVFYNATRKLVLKGADAIVFVADSEVGKMEENRESLANLRTNLSDYNLSLDAIPWVLQYNKRDLPNVYSIDELNEALNPDGKIPFFESVARDGKGVFETFRGISHLLMEKVTKDLRRVPGSPATRPAAGSESREGSPTREVARTTAPPVAPVQSIQHEAHTTPEPITGGNETRIDYGREIELPGALPVGSHAVDSHAVPTPVPAPMPAMVPVGPGASQVESVVVRAAEPRAVPVPQPSLVAPLPEVLAPVFQAPEAIAPAPPPAPRPAIAAVTHVRTVSAVAPGNGTTPEKVIVPVRLAKGGTYEIVIRLQIDADD